MNIKVADRLLDTEEYYFSKKLSEIEKMNQAGEKVINLGIGSPDLPPSPKVIETLREESCKSGNHGYQSYKGSPVLRQAFADWYARFYDVHLDSATEILPLMGSKEGILHICMTYLQAGDEALIPNPGYPTYASAVRLSGAKGVYYSLNESKGWLPDFKELEQLVTPHTKLMWINYPHMPTGTRATFSFFEKLVDFARANQILLCHDNPYSFILNPEPMSLLRVEGSKEVAIELNSLSKSSNMAGWRVGMLAGKAERINEILRFKSNMDSGMFLPLQLAAAKALSLEEDWYDSVNETYAKRKTLASTLLDQIGCTYSIAQSGLFIWAKIPKSCTNGYELSDKILQEARVFITPGGIFGSQGEKYIRVSLCASEETFKLAMQRIAAAKLSFTNVY